MKKIILAILVVLWMAFIFNMSSEDGNQSSNTSGQTIENVLSVVPEFEKQPEEVKKDVISNLQFVVRKSAHFIGYMILGILVFIFICQFEDINKKFIMDNMHNLCCLWWDPSTICTRQIRSSKGCFNRFSRKFLRYLSYDYM